MQLSVRELSLIKCCSLSLENYGDCITRWALACCVDGFYSVFELNACRLVFQVNLIVKGCIGDLPRSEPAFIFEVYPFFYDIVSNAPPDSPVGLAHISRTVPGPSATG